ncbi:D-lactate dehydrogenase [Secundilactobacillus kimchicus JCM 15530]|uniref:D-lactate dehydrogenase n=1 Tax=Secundilactobacillus kimchicus JCM 15530 TaxID=1302272 RepID=A0A0R1HV18_9LACO|nr:D-2-hydroxyacid dehydrogenase [Secundilactobacillus kimchicus]KRK47652.1 D-lactate dehydrogenase [Secundilactobacillus kimchicus JCM 15530]
MYHVRDDELIATQRWMASHPDVQVDTNTLPFNAETVELAAGYDGIVLQQHGPLGAPAVYKRLHELGIKQITLRITGYEIVDLKAASQFGLTVTNVPAYSPRSVAELVLAHTMWLVRHLGITAAREADHDFRWDGLEAAEIHNLTIGIIGAGKIGSAVARIFSALGATVIAADPIHRPELADVLTYTTHEDVFKTADIITMHTPLTPDTTHMINAQTLKLMKPTAFLINASRGPVVDTPALVASLQAGEIAGAGLDTVEGDDQLVAQDWRDKPLNNAPLTALLSMANVNLSPHIGFYTDVAVANMVEIALDDVVRIVSGEQPRHAVV